MVLAKIVRMFRFPRKNLFCTLLLSAACAVSVWAGDTRTLDWHELVPADWEPPIIAMAHDEAAERDVDSNALVAELDQQQVRLPGYMKPVVFEERSVTEFLLVPFLPHQVKHHAHLDANQMVYVTLAEPLVVDKPFDPIWVSGTLLLQTVMTDEGPAGYRLSDAQTAEYTY